jgi:hypothetical protein
MTKLMYAFLNFAKAPKNNCASASFISARSVVHRSVETTYYTASCHRSCQPVDIWLPEIRGCHSDADVHSSRLVYHSVYSG